MYHFEYPTTPTIDEDILRRYEMDVKKEMELLEAQRAARYGTHPPDTSSGWGMADFCGGFDWTPHHQSPPHPPAAKRQALEEHTEHIPEPPSPSPPKKRKMSRRAKEVNEPELDTRAITEQVLQKLDELVISQTQFAATLGRSQGTISDLLRNPKEWSEMKGGRMTFRKMKAFLEMSDEDKLRVCGEAMSKKESKPARAPRRVFTATQRTVLETIFSEMSHPSVDVIRRTGEELNLPYEVVNRFFVNSRRRARKNLVRNANGEEVENLCA